MPFAKMGADFIRACQRDLAFTLGLMITFKATTEADRLAAALAKKGYKPAI